MSAVPKAGDIILYDFTSESIGREIRKKRPALVVSDKDFNEKMGQAWICPITTGRAKKSRDAGYVVSLVNRCKKTKGSVVVDQLRSIHLRERKAKVTDKINDDMLDAILDEVHGKIFLVLGV